MILLWSGFRRLRLDFLRPFSSQSNCEIYARSGFRSENLRGQSPDIPDRRSNNTSRIGDRMPRAIFGAGEESWRSGGPGGAGCRSNGTMQFHSFNALRRFQVQCSRFNGLKAEVRFICSSCSNRSRASAWFDVPCSTKHKLGGTFPRFENSQNQNGGRQTLLIFLAVALFSNCRRAFPLRCAAPDLFPTLPSVCLTLCSTPPALGSTRWRAVGAAGFTALAGGWFS